MVASASVMAAATAGAFGKWWPHCRSRSWLHLAVESLLLGHENLNGVQRRPVQCGQRPGNIRRLDLYRIGAAQIRQIPGARKIRQRTPARLSAFCIR